jgi:Na+/H+ antiporter 1
MVLFFALMTKEVVEATAPGGVLHPWRRAMLPVFASIAAAAVPALMFVRIVNAFDEPRLPIGWPVSLSMDLAIGYFIARLIFGTHPVIPFLLLLGIASDALGFLALAVFNQTREVHLASGALILAGAIGIAAGLRWSRVRSFWPYLLAAGSVSWVGFFWIGLHPALALVPIMPFLPHAARDPGFFVDARPNARDTLSQFERWWKYPSRWRCSFSDSSMPACQWARLNRVPGDCRLRSLPANPLAFSSGPVSPVSLVYTFRPGLAGENCLSVDSSPQWDSASGCSSVTRCCRRVSCAQKCVWVCF